MKVRVFRNRIRDIAKDESGQSLLEFAIITPVLIMVLGFFLSMFQIMFALSSAYYADYIGARTYMVPGASQTVAQEQAVSILDASPMHSAFNSNALCTKTSIDTACEVTGTVNLIFPIIGLQGQVIADNFQVHLPLRVPTEGN